MRVSGTIVQGISSRPGTSWDGRSATAGRRAEPKRDDPQAAEDETPLPEPGVGAIVDRKV
jgi:hypothetical protein